MIWYMQAEEEMMWRKCSCRLKLAVQIWKRLHAPVTHKEDLNPDIFMHEKLKRKQRVL